MVLLEIGQLLTQGFILQLLVRSAEGQLIKDAAQSIDVCLYILVKGEFIFIPGAGAGVEMKRISVQVSSSRS